MSCRAELMKNEGPNAWNCSVRHPGGIVYTKRGETPDGAARNLAEQLGFRA
jgi:hypothetical protein